MFKSLQLDYESLCSSNRAKGLLESMRRESEYRAAKDQMLSDANQQTMEIDEYGFLENLSGAAREEEPRN